jgi:hypothetical protein
MSQQKKPVASLLVFKKETALLSDGDAAANRFVWHANSPLQLD